MFVSTVLGRLSTNAVAGVNISPVRFTHTEWAIIVKDSVYNRCMCRILVTLLLWLRSLSGVLWIDYEARKLTLVPVFFQ